MKISLHIPTEQYGFVAIDLEIGETEELYLTANSVAATYKVFSEAFKPRPINEMPAKDFDAFVENMLMGVPNHTETLEKLSPAQKTCHNTIKRALSRIKSKGLSTLEDNE